MLSTLSTIWEETDGCAKQYCCALALYLLSMVASTFGIVIDRGIGAPGHGKDVVDGLNACDKRYLREVLNQMVKNHKVDMDRIKKKDF